eukprot:542996_1
MAAGSVSLSSDGNVVAAGSFFPGNVRVYEYDSGCDAVGIDLFLGSCSTLWNDNAVHIATIEDEIASLKEDDIASLQDDIASLKEDDIVSLQDDIASLKEEIEKRFEGISSPVVKETVGTFGDADHMVLLISLMINFFLISLILLMMWNAKKHKEYSLVVQSE